MKTTYQYPHTKAAPATRLRMPNDIADAINLNTKVFLLSASGPERVLEMVRQGISERDVGLLSAARIIIEGSLGKNSWQSPIGKTTAPVVLNMIEDFLEEHQ